MLDVMDLQYRSNQSKVFLSWSYRKYKTTEYTHEWYMGNGMGIHLDHLDHLDGGT